MNKIEILQLIIEFLEREEGLLISAALSAKEAATESEAKPENQYDTRGLEQSYLAAGQAKRAESLKTGILHMKNLSLAAFDSTTPIDISALVQLEADDEGVKTYFILPSHGGIKVNYKSTEILTLSPESPLGESLLGKISGDLVEVKMGSRIRFYSIISVD